jgi:ABC-type transport system substrate-binding protein
MLRRMLRGARGRATLLAIGLLLTACQTTPSPSASAGPSVAPFVGMSYPADAPADCAYGGEIAQIKAVDRLTVEFSLCAPDPAFLSKVALPNNAIQDADWLAKNGANQSIRTKANGTGPYMISGLPATGDQLTLTRYDGYWGPKAKAATVLVQWNPDPAARLLALRTDKADGIDDPGSDAIATIQGDSALKLQPREELSTLYIGVSNTYQPFDSLKIRQALASGIDRQQIVSDLLPPGAAVADYFTPCAIDFGCAGDAWYAHDVVAARALLAKPPFPGALFTHIYYSDTAECGLPDPGLVAQELKDQLTSLGFSADLQPLAAATFLKDLSAGLLDGLYVGEWCPGSADASGFLDGPFNDRANPQFGTLDPSITAALTAGDRAAGASARQAAYQAANDAIRNEVPMIPIAHGSAATAWKADVTGAASSPLDGEQFATMDPGGRPELVWMQATAPSTLYCADATVGDTLRVCQNLFESLYGFKPGTAQVTPSLAESCKPNQQQTVWTCHLRSGVTFHDGASLDANDVVASFAAQWDYRQPMHASGTAPFAAWVSEFGPFLNAPAATP